MKKQWTRIVSYHCWHEDIARIEALSVSRPHDVHLFDLGPLPTSSEDLLFFVVLALLRLFIIFPFCFMSRSNEASLSQFSRHKMLDQNQTQIIKDAFFKWSWSKLIIKTKILINSKRQFFLDHAVTGKMSKNEF